MNREAVLRLIELWASEVHKERPDEIAIPCPFAPYGGHKHKTDENPNFSITIRDDKFSVCHCFCCGEGGTVLQVAKDLAELDSSFKDSIEFVRKAEKGIFIPGQIDSPKKKKKFKKDKALHRVLRVSEKTVSPGLRDRGIEKTDIQKWNLRYDALNNRDLFPIYDKHGTLVGLSGRRCDEEQTEKYYHYGTSAQSLPCYFYGEQFVDFTIEEATLVEGPLDVIAEGKHSPNVLGLLGTQVMTENRVSFLKQSFSILTFMFDGDPPGVEAAFRLGLELHKLFTVFVTFLPKGADPFSASAAQRLKARKERILWSLVDWPSKEGFLPIPGK